MQDNIKEKAWVVYIRREDACGVSSYYWTCTDNICLWSKNVKDAKIIYSREELNKITHKFNHLWVQVEEILV